MKKSKKILALALAAVISVMQAGSFVPAREAEAASTVEPGEVNLLAHSSFEETDVPLSTFSGGTELGNWYAYQSETKKVNHDGHDSDWAVELGRAGCAIEQDSDDLQVGGNYVATVWAKATNTSAVTAYFGVKYYTSDRSQEIKVKIDSTEYRQYTIPFTYSGSPSGCYPRVYVWVESMTGGAVYADDFNLVMDSDLKRVSVENGKITATYKEGYTGTPSAADFRAVYSSSLEEDVTNELVITGSNVNGNQLEMLFAPVEQEPVEQLINVDLTYVPKNQTLALDYTVDANGEKPVEAKIASFTAENGTATILLDQKPTISPVSDDFVLQKSTDGSTFETVPVSGFVYEKSTKTVTLDFKKVYILTEAQNITLRVLYGGEKYDTTFTVEPGNQTTYYVDATGGNDNNSGTSPEQAIATIDKANTIEFQPGDKLLFKCGEQWTGALKPMGSGEEAAPIVISSYGEGDKPVLKPGADWTIPYFNVASSVIRNPTVNNVITFYNQEYWEVSNLELYDPGYAQNANTRVYRRGINISAEDAGDLHHFTFDNLTIHGFRGPNDNNGKSSGGIIMTVYSDPNNAANRVPTAVHDITVTNCEMYDLGRSGFNFVSPWTTRVGDEWGSFDYVGYGDWKPYENITISNNTIYNIDGDGILIDGCKNVLVEHNTVYRTVLNSAFAVGMFNWNSDDTVFQFNEVYDTNPADSLNFKAGDGQGVEIDALNKNTLVQYNYIHDNTGGSVMWCSTPSLRTIDGVYRYNIFENDMTEHGVIDWRANHKGSMVYNNVFYFGKLPEGSASRKFMQYGYTGGASEAKIYNNIFYNLDAFNMNGFNEQEIDWESNIFYGFDSVPSNDSTVITEDPKFVNPGSGSSGIDSLDGYKLQADSPAINAGINIEDNGGRDYFGAPLRDGKTDIGAAEYTVLADKTALEAAIKAAEELTQEGYTEETWSVFADALEKAKKVEADEYVPQADVDQAVKELNEAKDALKEKEPEPDPKLPYKDVPEDQWYYEDVYDVYLKGLMTGLDPTTFGPGNNLVRGQFAVILYRMESQPEIDFKNTFPDVADGQFYSKAVIWAAENKIVTGYSNTGTFGPNDPITREQMATMMFRYANYKKQDTSERKKLDIFPDGDKVQEFAVEALEWCAAKEIITGKGVEKAIVPQGNTNRAECAAIINRYTDYVE